MIEEKKGAWEKKIKEARTNSKTLWSVVQEPLGKTKNKEDQVYLYREDNTKHEVEEDWEQFMNAWKADIYQKTPRIDLEFWYGTKDKPGQKERMQKEEIEDKNTGEYRIMHRPEMTEEELTIIVNKQNNGKAAGIDRIKAKLMKHLIKTERYENHY